VSLDTVYLDCQGKVRRITDSWNIDTGECLSTVDVALFRHNGSGLTSDTTIAAPAKAPDPTETLPETRLDLKVYIGGQDDRPEWEDVKDESGYFVNLTPVGADKFGGTSRPSTSTTNLSSQYYLSNTWQRDPSNPEVAKRIYEEGFAVKYPDIDADYADPTDAATTAAFEVAIPQDTLVLTSG
jgi:hypothetical protein